MPPVTDNMSEGGLLSRRSVGLCGRWISGLSCGVDVLLPTVAEVLELPEVVRGEPVVRAGAEQLDRRVRWVHVSEVSDIAHLLEGGELILSTGIALPSDPDALAQYVEELSAAGATGLAVELGRRYQGALPPKLIAAAERSSL